MEVDIGIIPLQFLNIFYNYALSVDFIHVSINHGFLVTKCHCGISYKKSATFLCVSVMLILQNG